MSGCLLGIMADLSLIEAFRFAPSGPASRSTRSSMPRSCGSPPARFVGSSSSGGASGVTAARRAATRSPKASAPCAASAAWRCRGNKGSTDWQHCMFRIRDDADCVHAAQFSIEDWFELPATVRDACKTSMLERGLAGLGFLTACIVLVVLWVRLRGVVSIAGIQRDALMLAGFAILVMAPILFIYFAISGRRLRHRMRRVLLEQRRCPVCLYELAGQTADDDGLLRCPECAARWRIECGHPLSTPGSSS
jgi:hypothetical protein